MRWSLLILLAALAPAPWARADRLAFPDGRGRHFLPHGFVTLTADAMGEIRYTADDYRRMARMGANFQVVRIFLGKIGGWPGRQPDPAHLAQMDEMARLGREAGMRTAFRLVVQDIPGFSENDWRDLYIDRDGRQGILAAAWRRIFERYRDDPSVFGYDLLNEPVATRARGYLWAIEPRFKNRQIFLRDRFVPLYRKLIDELHEVDPAKRALFQPYHVPPWVQRQTKFPALPFEIPVGREGIVFAPHYGGDRPAEAIRRYRQDAAVSSAPMLLGEYGKPITAETDRDARARAALRGSLIATVAELDRAAIGAVRAWWCGSRVFLRDLTQDPKARTWALFSDPSPTGAKERRYICDVIARPRPLVVAGEVRSFGFDFDTRVFEMTFVPDPTRGESEIFVPVDRHYRDGFRISFDGVDLALDPGTPTGLRALAPGTESRAADYRWDPERMRLVVRDWRAAGEPKILRITPPPPGD